MKLPKNQWAPGTTRTNCASVQAIRLQPLMRHTHGLMRASKDNRICTCFCFYRTWSAYKSSLLSCPSANSRLLPYVCCVSIFTVYRPLLCDTTTLHFKNLHSMQPLQSPDLNPTEMVWDGFDPRVNIKQPTLLLLENQSIDSPTMAGWEKLSSK